jgi:hypothetical protein
MKLRLTHTGTHWITEVEQRWARLVLGGVTRKSTPVAVGRCSRLLWLGVGRGIPHVKGYNSTPQLCHSKE